MKRFVKMVIAFLCLSVLIVSHAETEVVTNDGLELLSPCAFFDGKYTLLSVSDSSDSTVEFNWINYTFASADEISYEEVKADAARYRQALLDSGYFQEVSEGDHQLIYIGDRQVAVATSRGKVQNWHVGARGTYGWKGKQNININLVEGFSFSDIEVTSNKQQNKSGSNSTSTKSTPNTSGSTCTYCDGDGKCNRCNGKGSGYRYETEYVNGVPVTKSVYKTCYGSYCDDGKCSECGGTGVR